MRKRHDVTFKRRGPKPPLQQLKDAPLPPVEKKRRRRWRHRGRHSRPAASGDPAAAAAPTRIRPAKVFAALDDMEDVFSAVLGREDHVVELPPFPAV